MTYSDDAKLYQPPYHPSCINGQLKAVAQQIKKDANHDGESEAWQAHATVRRISLSLSTRHADGAATIARVFRSSITAAKGKVAILPSLSNSDAFVMKEALKAADLIKNNPPDVDCAYSNQSQLRPGDSEIGDLDCAESEDAFLDTSPIEKAIFRDHISEISTPALAKEAAVSLRRLLDTREPVSDTDLHDVLVRHKIHFPMSSAINTRPFPEDCTDTNRFIVRRTLLALEQSFRMLTCLPRNLDRLTINPDSSPTSHPATFNSR
jgi:hypothetical protein